MGGGNSFGVGGIYLHPISNFFGKQTVGENTFLNP